MLGGQVTRLQAEDASVESAAHELQGGNGIAHVQMAQTEYSKELRGTNEAVSKDPASQLSVGHLFGRLQPQYCGEAQLCVYMVPRMHGSTMRSIGNSANWPPPSAKVLYKSIIHVNPTLSLPCSAQHSTVDGADCGRLVAGEVHSLLIHLRDACGKPCTSEAHAPEVILRDAEGLSAETTCEGIEWQATNPTSQKGEWQLRFVVKLTGAFDIYVRAREFGDAVSQASAQVRHKGNTDDSSLFSCPTGGVAESISPNGMGPNAHLEAYGDAVDGEATSAEDALHWGERIPRVELGPWAITVIAGGPCIRTSMAASVLPAGHLEAGAPLSIYFPLLDRFGNCIPLAMAQTEAYQFCAHLRRLAPVTEKTSRHRRPLSAAATKEQQATKPSSGAGPRRRPASAAPVASLDASATGNVAAWHVVSCQSTLCSIARAKSASMAATIGQKAQQVQLRPLNALQHAMQGRSALSGMPCKGII